jgi:hypothetical protein
MSGGRPVVGVIGGYGAVGGAAAAALRRLGGVTLRLGGRDGQRAARAAHTLGAEGVAVDLYDEESLGRFCADCDVVIQAGGASYQVLDMVARAALDAGAHYVDAGGDLPVRDRVADLRPESSGRVAVVSAGMMPGLTGLLPRWLAGRFAEPVELTAYVGVVDRLTPSGSIDYLLSLADRERESRAAWLDGRRVDRAAQPETGVALPFFPGRVTVYPYFGYEAERVTESLHLRTVRWHSVFDDGGNMVAALGRLQGAMAGATDLETAARELAAAAALDLFGREPYQLMVYSMHGRGADGQPLAATVMARSASATVLTGEVCALSARAAMDGAVRPGVHLAAECLDPATTLAALRDSGALTALETFDVAVDARSSVEEGVL